MAVTYYWLNLPGDLFVPSIHLTWPATLALALYRSCTTGIRQDQRLCPRDPSSISSLTSMRCIAFKFTSAISSSSCIPSPAMGGSMTASMLAPLFCVGNGVCTTLVTQTTPSPYCGLSTHPTSIHPPLSGARFPSVPTGDGVLPALSVAGMTMRMSRCSLGDSRGDAQVSLLHSPGDVIEYWNQVL